MVRRAFLIAGAPLKRRNFSGSSMAWPGFSFFSWPIKLKAGRDCLVFFLRAGPRFCFMANFYPGEWGSRQGKLSEKEASVLARPSSVAAAVFSATVARPFGMSARCHKCILQKDCGSGCSLGFLLANFGPIVTAGWRDIVAFLPQQFQRRQLVRRPVAAASDTYRVHGQKRWGGPVPENQATEPARTAEGSRLAEARDRGTPWKLWGPYLSERQWGTVREDYSESGDAWNYFNHDQARSRAYHWGEDGIAGISDEKQRLCFALALWNGRDPILKERLFGLTNSEGNHGEDVKEYYFYLDSTPTHSYMKLLYKYPQREYPYRDLVETNQRRGRTEMEYELLDTGVFNEDRYFDVFVEYAKQTPTDILIQISLCNRGPDAAPVHVLPTLWFRNIWTWWPGTPKPSLRAVTTKNGVAGIAASDAELGDYFLYCEGKPPLLFTENETNNQRIFGSPNAGPYVKDGINDFVVAGRQRSRQSAADGDQGGRALPVGRRAGTDRHRPASADQYRARRHRRSLRQRLRTDRWRAASARPTRSTAR